MRYARDGARLVAVLLIVAASGLCGQAARAPQRGAEDAPAGGKRLVNPESVAARLMLATPEQRRRALERFSPERQAQIRKQLAWFDSLPKPEQQMQIRRLERFASLPPDRQIAVRVQMEALNHLPPGRRQAIRRALALLQRFPEDQRAARLNSPAFRNRFAPEELKIISDLADAWLLPPM